MDSNVFEKIIEEETTKQVLDKLKNLYGGDEKLKGEVSDVAKVIRDDSDEGRRISLIISFMCGVLLKPDEGIWWIIQQFVEDWESVEISDCDFWLRCSVNWRVQEPSWDEVRRTSSFRGSWDEDEVTELIKGEDGWICTTSKIHQEIWEEKAKQGKNIDVDEKSSKNSKNYFDSIKKELGNKYYGKKVDMKEMQCYNCWGFGNYARDCRRKKEARVNDSDEVQYAYAEDNDSYDVLFMANTQSNIE